MTSPPGDAAAEPQHAAKKPERARGRDGARFWELWTWGFCGDLVALANRQELNEHDAAYLMPKCDYIQRSAAEFDACYERLQVGRLLHNHACGARCPGERGPVALPWPLHSSAPQGIYTPQLVQLWHDQALPAPIPLSHARKHRMPRHVSGPRRLPRVPAVLSPRSLACSTPRSGRCASCTGGRWRWVRSTPRLRSPSGNGHGTGSRCTDSRAVVQTAEPCKGLRGWADCAQRSGCWPE